MASDSPVAPLERILWSVGAGVCFAASVSLFVVPFIGAETMLPNPLSNSDGAMGAAALLAAFLVGGLSWLVIEGGVERRYIRAGVIAGIVTGTVAHPVMWFIWGLLNGSIWMGILFLVPLFWLFGLLLFGIITVSLAIGAGVVVGTLRIVGIRYREQRAE